MNNEQETYFIIYNPHKILAFSEEVPFMGFVNPGYHLVPYVIPEVKKVYEGTYLNCLLVLSGLVSFSLN